jgi:hypothetical protein
VADDISFLSKPEQKTHTTCFSGEQKERAQFPRGGAAHLTKKTATSVRQKKTLEGANIKNETKHISSFLTNSRVIKKRILFRHVLFF